MDALSPSSSASVFFLLVLAQLEGTWLSFIISQRITQSNSKANLPFFFKKKKQQHQNINLWSVILDLNHLHTPTIHFWSLFLIIYFTYLNIISSIQYLQTHLSSSIHPHHSSGDHLISVYSKQITKLMSPYLLFRFFQKFNHLIGCNIFINCSQLGNSSPNCVGGSVTGLPIYVKLSKDDQV